MKQNKKLPNLSVLDKNAFFYRDLLRKASDQRIHHKKKKKKISKPRLFFIFFFINQTSLVNIYAENTAKLQSRAGRDVFGGVQPTRHYHEIYRLGAVGLSISNYTLKIIWVNFVKNWYFANNCLIKIRI